MRTILFTIISVIVLNALPKTLIAQETEPDCEKIKKEIKNLNDDIARFSAEIEKLNSIVDQIDLDIKKAQADFKYWSKWPTTTEETKTKFLDAIAKMQDTHRRTKENMENDRLNIQAMKDVIDDLLNKLANCGNKKVAMKDRAPSSNNLLGSNTGNFEVCAGVGYGFSFNGSLLGQNKTFTANDRTFDGVYGSWAQGENFFIKTDLKLSDCINAGVEFDYTYGKDFEFSTNTIGNNPTTINYNSRYTDYSATPFIQFNPCGINKLAPYIDLGMRLDFANSIDQNIVQTQINNNVTTVTTQDATFKGAFTTGFDASIGVKYYMKKNWALIAELNFSNSNFIASTGTINSYTINGADQMGTLNTSQKQTNYVKSYTVPNSGFNPNSPSEALKSSQPASSLKAKVGAFLSFGEYKRKYGHK